MTVDATLGQSIGEVGGPAGSQRLRSLVLAATGQTSTAAGVSVVTGYSSGNARYPVSDENKQPKELVMLTVAWAQFIALVAVVEKSDMRRLDLAWQEIAKWDIRVWLYDWSRFGGIAVALNVLAVCFLSFPGLAQVVRGPIIDGRPKASQALLNALWVIGSYTWLFSFVVFVVYLNWLSALFLFGSVVVLVGLMQYFRLIEKG